MEETTQVSQEPFRCAMFSLFPATVRNISKLPDEQFCMLMRALIAHYWEPETSYDGEDSLVSVVYDFASGEMDRYTEKCRKNSKNGSQPRPNGKKSKAQEEPTEAEDNRNVTKDERNLTTEEPSLTNEERNVTQDQGQDQGQGQDKGQGQRKRKEQNKNPYQDSDTDTAPDAVRRRELAAAEDGEDAFRKEFEKLWERYPRRENKEYALPAYIRDRKAGVSEQEIRSGLERYLAYLDTAPPEEKELVRGDIWFIMQCWKKENEHLYKTKLRPRHVFLNKRY